MDQETKEFLEKRANPERPAPMTFEVKYGDRTILIEERYVGPRLMLFASCPKCGQAAGTNRPDHEWSYARENPAGTLSIRPSLVCDGCKLRWHVVVTNGEAKDC